MRILALTLVAAILAASAVPAPAQNRARSEVLDLEEKDRALVAKEGVKQRREQGNMSRKSGKGDPNCGSVDIGNDNDKKGSSRIAERQKTVIVTGPVINTANCR
jgi:hypothetical protein